MSAITRDDEIARRFSNLTRAETKRLGEAATKLGIAVADIANYRFDDASEQPGVVIVSTAGKKLRWPADAQTELALRRADLEAEDLTARAEIEEHRRAIAALEARRQDIGAALDRITLQHQQRAAARAATPARTAER